MKVHTTDDERMKAVNDVFRLAAEQYLSRLLTVREFQDLVNRCRLPDPKHGELDPNTGLRAIMAWPWPWPWPTRESQSRGFYIGLRN